MAAPLFLYKKRHIDRKASFSKPGRDALSKACTERDSLTAHQAQQKTGGPISRVLADQLINRNLA
jgi:hypothetical protein